MSHNPYSHPHAKHDGEPGKTGADPGQEWAELTPDVKETATTAALRQVGCEVHIGHDPKHVLDASCVVISQAIRESNVELKAVRKHGLHVVRRVEALAAMMAGYRSVAVAGTDPSFALSAELNKSGSNAHTGSVTSSSSSPR